MNKPSVTEALEICSFTKSDIEKHIKTGLVIVHTPEEFYEFWMEGYESDEDIIEEVEEFKKEIAEFEKSKLCDTGLGNGIMALKHEGNVYVVTFPL